MMGILLGMIVSSATLVSCEDDEPQWTPVEPDPVENQDDNKKQEDKDVVITGATGEVGDSYAIVFGVVNLDAISVSYSSVEFGVLVSETSDFNPGYFYKASNLSGNMFSVRVGSLKAKTKYWYRAYVRISSPTYHYWGDILTFTTLKKEDNDEETTEIDGHEYVDLGLSSGTLWATMNVGATSPEDYGYYYAWGETQKKSNYSYTTYFDSSYYKYSNYKDGMKELLPEDDAAYVNWGKEWRMPSLAQFNELINTEYTTSTWTIQSGVKGLLVTSKTNGRSIFLPAAGTSYEKSLNGVGSWGVYWSRTLHSDYSDIARYLYFHSAGKHMGDDGGRYYGQSIRAVVESE